MNYDLTIEIDVLFHPNRKLSANQRTRKAFLEKLTEAGFGQEQLTIMQSLINAERVISLTCSNMSHSPVRPSNE